jgi:hypothetical protein
MPTRTPGIPSRPRFRRDINEHRDGATTSLDNASPIGRLSLLCFCPMTDDQIMSTEQIRRFTGLLFALVMMGV